MAAQCTPGQRAASSCTCSSSPYDQMPSSSPDPSWNSFKAQNSQAPCVCAAQAL